MYYYNSGFYGMHMLWWVFWGIMWVSLFTFWLPVPRRRLQSLKESPLEVLKRRLANGEINEQKYLSLKTHIEGGNVKESSLSPMRAV